ncbi:hypothetical protein [Agromyces sp. Soil535]|uniref:hypothetical protein n=1 Tax=Agromyces sp. Soil535 TaxID=1736390 RepID=UPI0006F6DC56|nr:hypothetical protein [Agromyces sp. Soil535]KRE22453.1 hypothetical protein ASG80_11125 [Agromyces sp. Soil535]
MSIFAPSPLAAVAKRLGSSWWALLIVGIAWIVIGFVVLRFDNSTVYVISIAFGILVLLSAIGEIFRGVAEIAAAFTVRQVAQAAGQ